MNVNHEHKIIWWAPERCGTKAVANIFSKLGFKFYFKTDITKNFVQCAYQSHQIEIPHEFSDYKIIFSIRNPYDRVLSLFNNFTNVGKNIIYTKGGQSNFIQKYEIFLKELFENNDENWNKPILNNYILKYSFKTKVPDMVIRMESIIEDLSKIDFVKNSELWRSGYIHDYLIDNEHIVRRPYSFDTVYTREGAKLVYEHHTKHFILGGYDPFSFTNELIPNKEKMDFIHDNLQ
jgi:hypothetical protein